MVDLPVGQPVDQPLQVVHSRHAVPADVEHRAADGEVRPVLDVCGRHLEAGGCRPTARGEPLFQGRRRPEHARRRRGLHGDAVRAYAQAIALVGRKVNPGGSVGARRVDRDPAGDGVARTVSGARGEELLPRGCQCAPQARDRELEFLRGLRRFRARRGHMERNGCARWQDQGIGGVRELDPPRRRPETHGRRLRSPAPGCRRRSGWYGVRRPRPKSRRDGRSPGPRSVPARRPSAGRGSASCRS